MFLTQILGALNAQELDAVVYRGIDDDRIRFGHSIADSNRADVRTCDAFVAIVSERYLASPYCLSEARTAAAERLRRDVPILVCAWPTSPADPSSWPEAARTLVEAREGTWRMFARVESGAVAAHIVDAICRDVCEAVGVAYDDDPDPIERMKLIRRTREAVRTFPPAENAQVDGDLRRILGRLVAFHDDCGSHVEAGAYRLMADSMRRIRELAEARLGRPAAAYLRLGEGVY